MIHNPGVNRDLEERGIKFLMKTDGTHLIDLKTLTPDDIVIVPAFGTTIELQKKLESLGINPYKDDATCPFVEKVWKRAEQLGQLGFTVIVHGKKTHEETRATFSHSKQTAPTLIVLNMKDAEVAISYMKDEISVDSFKEYFADAMSSNFKPEIHLKKIGVVNQTTMLASETKSISEAFKQALIEINGLVNLNKYFGDTRDTLCYATYENQSATQAMTEDGADLAIVVGGYNSSNTSHLVELCEEYFPTFYIKDHLEILSEKQIRHYDLNSKIIIESSNWLPNTRTNSNNDKIDIAITAGASCPDKEVDLVITRLLDFFPEKLKLEQVLADFTNNSRPHITL